jgi:hypothetical protein
VLDKHVEAVPVDGFLQAQAAAREEVLELVLRDAIEQGYLLGDLVDGLLERGEPPAQLRAGGGLEVETDHADAVAELLHVLTGAGHAIVVVEVAEGTEHAHGGAPAEGHDQPLLLRVLDIEDLDDGSRPGDGERDDLLVDLLGVLGRLREEHAVPNDLEAGLERRGVGVHEQTLVHEVAAQGRLGRRRARQVSRRAERLHAEHPARGGAVEVLGL